MVPGGAYFGETLELPGLVSDEFTINGQTYNNIRQLDANIDIFPDESIEAGMLFFLPEDFEAGGAVLQIHPSQDSGSKNIALGDPENVDYPCVSSSLPSEPVEFGGTIEYRGLIYSVEGYDFATQIGAKTASSGAQWLIVSMYYENSTSGTKDLPPRPTVLYGGEEPEAAGVVVREFEANGKQYSGIYAEGQTLGPNESYSGVVAVEVPEEFDESLLEVVQAFVEADSDVTFVPG